MRVALYARVSTKEKDQDPETQLVALREYLLSIGITDWTEFADRASANDYKHRISWADLLAGIRRRQFNVVYVWKLDRAWRSTRKCLNTLYDWQDRGVGFRSLQEPLIDTTTSTGSYVLAIFAAGAEFESGMISERVRAGMHRARKQGHPLG